MIHTLNIFFNIQHVGKLTFDDQIESFDLEYISGWNESGFGLSPILDFKKSYNSKDIKNYIENLLPEGEGLDKFIEFVKISKANKFGLLQKIGNETSGAFSFLKDEVFNIQTTFREISYIELCERIEKRKEIPIEIWDDKPRLSVAGVQEKLPVCKIDGEYGLAEGELASTHILKFDKSKRNLVLNEYLSLHLAKIAKLDISNAELMDFNGELVLEVQRFDRKIISSQKIQKIHVIDSCQALGVSPSYKYERVYGSGEDIKDFREGVSFSKLHSLLLYTKVPLLSIIEVMKWTIVNLILGNSDAHGKNISFFVDKDGISLTPFYDILNIQLYKDSFQTDLAMAFDDEFQINNLTAFDIAYFCYQIQTTPKAFSVEFNKISKTILKELESSPIVEKLIQYDEEFILRYIKDVEQRIEFLKEPINLAKDVKKEDIL